MLPNGLEGGSTMINETCASTPFSDRGVNPVIAMEKGEEKEFLAGLKLVGLDDPGGELIVSPAVDWLTATTTKSDIGHTWMKRYDDMRKANQKSQMEVGHKKWQALGYKGWATRGMRVGFSEKNGWICILSGEAAGQLWELFIPSAKVTRIDLAVTVRLGVAMENVAKLYYDFLDVPNKAIPKRALIRNSAGGQTFYLGSRTSESFGRVYDKGVEEKSSEPGFRWRYEVEYKKPRSDAISRALGAAREKNSHSIISTVHNWFTARGAFPLFRSGGAGLQTETETRIRTPEKKILWLRSQVRPTVQYLLSVGRGNDAIEALGLTGRNLSGSGAESSSGVEKGDD